METNTKLAAGVVLTLILAMSGTYYIGIDDDAYYCEAKDMVMICDKLSSGVGTRCYFENTYKICKEGWVEIEIGQEIKQESTEQTHTQPDKKYLCNQVECISIE